MVVVWISAGDGPTVKANSLFRRKLKLRWNSLGTWLEGRQVMIFAEKPLSEQRWHAALVGQGKFLRLTHESLVITQSTYDDGGVYKPEGSQAEIPRSRVVYVETDRTTWLPTIMATVICGFIGYGIPYSLGYGPKHSWAFTIFFGLLGSFMFRGSTKLPTEITVVHDD
jgi:hypothetical protein